MSLGPSGTQSPQALPAPATAAVRACEPARSQPEKNSAWSYMCTVTLSTLMLAGWNKAHNVLLRHAFLCYIAFHSDLPVICCESVLHEECLSLKLLEPS